jgi:hypothetical protein
VRHEYRWQPMVFLGSSADNHCKMPQVPMNWFCGRPIPKHTLVEVEKPIANMRMNRHWHAVRSSPKKTQGRFETWMLLRTPHHFS